MELKQLAGIDKAFRHIKVFTFVVITCYTVVICFVVKVAFDRIDRAQSRIYVLANDKALEAFSAQRKDNIEVEARDHVKMFHYYFFSLSPDDKAIQNSISKAFNLADSSAKDQYNNLRESGYYASMIAGNVNQQIEADSIVIDTKQYPYRFRYYGTQQIIRRTATITRSMVTEGYLRNTARSDNNNHGFLIERWQVIENKDINIQNH